MLTSTFDVQRWIFDIASKLLKMRLLALAVTLALFSGLSYGQDTLKTKQSRETARSQFIDKNANGIDDNLEGPRKRKGKDRFVDKDGDGIADDRARGMGFKRGAMATPSPDGSGTGGKRYRGGKQ